MAWYGGWQDPVVPTAPDSRHTSGDQAHRAPKDEAALARVGVILGRFLPPHLGHAFLADEAFAQCGWLHIVTPQPRGAALETLHRQAMIECFRDLAELTTVTPAQLPAGGPGDGPFIDQWVRIVQALSPSPTHLFSSDPRGAGALAKAANLVHVILDPERTTHSIRATDIRADVFGRFHFIAPGARATYAIRVALVGPESAGKTTLARELHSALGAVVVKDGVRALLEHSGAMLPTQAQLQDEVRTLPAKLRDAAREADTGIVVLDGSSMLETQAWGRRLGFPTVAAGRDTVLGHEGPSGTAEEHHLWLLCRDDFGFVGLPERDQPEARAAMTRFLREQLDKKRARGALVVEIGGDGPTRVETAVRAIRDCIAAETARLALAFESA